MSSVTFDVAVGGDGSTVTDDNNATTGLREGGWKTRFVPCFTQQVAVANYIVTKAGEASTSATASAASATAAAASYDAFDDRYLGAKTSDPSVDNDGNTLLTGALYWNTTSSVMKIWTGSAWFNPNIASGYLALTGGTMTGAITFAAGQSFTGTLPLTGGTMTGAITFAAGQFGTNVNTFLTTPSSLNLKNAVTDETGSGALVFATSPTLVTPALGTPSSGTLSSCTVDGTDAVGFRNIPINSQSAAYTAVLADSGKCILHPSTDANARTFTIPANGSVAYSIGTAISFVNMTSQVVSIAITTDTMYLAGTGTTGTRSLAQYGTATVLKMTSTTWIISGAGLT
jgi:hypothetical protein